MTKITNFKIITLNLLNLGDYFYVLLNFSFLKSQSGMLGGSLTNKVELLIMWSQFVL